MRRILVTASAALFTALAVAAFAAPANAGGNFNFSIGVGGWGPGWGYPGYYGGYAQPYPVNNWSAHVSWCFDHKGPSYNPNTNTYVTKYGKMKVCHSPFA